MCIRDSHSAVYEVLTSKTVPLPNLVREVVMGTYMSHVWFYTCGNIGSKSLIPSYLLYKKTAIRKQMEEKPKGDGKELINKRYRRMDRDLLKRIQR